MQTHNFNELKAKALKQLRQGKSLYGKDGAFTVVSQKVNFNLCSLSFYKI